MYKRCPRSWEFRYIKNLKIPPSGAIVMGSAYHTAIATNFKNKMVTSNDFSEAELTDAFDTSWNKELQNEINWQDEKPDLLKDQSYKLILEYRKWIAPKVFPIAVEQTIFETIDDKVIFQGIVDLETEKEIIDHKVKGKMITQSDADKDYQVLSYCFLRKKPDFSFHVAIKKKFPEVQIVSVHKNANQINWWIESVKQIVSQIESGNFPPNNDHFLCSPRWCGYYSLCQDMKGKNYFVF